MKASTPCPVELEHSVAALRTECGALDVLIEHMRSEDLARPTRLPQWTVQQLLAHVVRGVGRIRAYLSAPVPPEAEIGWLDYWSAVREVADPAAIAKRAAEFATRVNDRPVLEVWRETWRRAVEEAAATPPDRNIKCPFGAIRLDHYLTTRVFEVTVHGLDLRAALDLEEVATPLGLQVTVEVLTGLLDGPRPDDLGDDVAFVLAATGRREHPDPRLPVVS